MHGLPHVCHYHVEQQSGLPQLGQAHLSFPSCFPLSSPSSVQVTFFQNLQLSSEICCRWGLIPCDSFKLDDELTVVDVFVLPLLLYSVWQAAYLLTTEVLLFHKMEEDPQLITSMRSILFS